MVKNPYKNVIILYVSIVLGRKEIYMNRTIYFDYIEKKLTLLSHRILNRGKLNILDFNIHAEQFYADLMNKLLGYSLINLNAITQNVPAIDLIDRVNKIIIQLSSTCSKQKIENSLNKIDFPKYEGYNFKFIALVDVVDQKLRSKNFSAIKGIEFNPNADILDIRSLLTIIINQSIDKQKEIYDFIKAELGEETDIVKMDSNLTTIINILSTENLNLNYETPQINPYQIKKKIDYNNLSSIEPIIDEYKIFYSKINEQYIEFDKGGQNKSLSVLNHIKQQYVDLCREKDLSEADLFFQIINKLIKTIKNSKNYLEIPYEELEMCVSIITVDAFIKCKIFKNPEGYDYAATR